MPRRTLVVVYGNLRPDIVEIYGEVERQAVRNKLDVKQIYTTAAFLAKKRSVYDWLCRIGRIIVGARYLFRQNMMRYWLLRWRVRVYFAADYAYFMSLSPINCGDFVFMLNVGHSGGFAHAAKSSQLKVIVHQHGDYYSTQNPQFKYHEKGGDVNLVWNNEARDLIKSNVKGIEVIVSGSIKHATLQRRGPRDDRKSGAIVYLDTLLAHAQDDLRVAIKVANWIKKTKKQFSEISVAVKFHPIRKRLIKNNNLHSRRVKNIFLESCIPEFDSELASVGLGITCYSNAIYDLLSSSVPCFILLLEGEERPRLTAVTEYPGVIFDVGDIDKRLADIFLGGEKKGAMKMQREAAAKAIGTPEMVDEAFDKLLSENCD